MDDNGIATGATRRPAVHDGLRGSERDRSDQPRVSGVAAN